MLKYYIDVNFFFCYVSCQCGEPGPFKFFDKKRPTLPEFLSSPINISFSFLFSQSCVEYHLVLGTLIKYVNRFVIIELIVFQMVMAQLLRWLKYCRALEWIMPQDFNRKRVTSIIHYPYVNSSVFGSINYFIMIQHLN